jgi:hypothetical protein
VDSPLSLVASSSQLQLVLFHRALVPVKIKHNNRVSE